MTSSKKDNTLFSFHDSGDFLQLRYVFDQAGYTQAGVLEALRVKDFLSIRSTDLALLLYHTNQGRPIDVLIRLFLMEVPCSVNDVEQAIRPMKLETLVKAGLVQINETAVRAKIKIMPFQNLLVAYDLPQMLHTELGHNYVLGVGGSTITLANLTVRRHANQALDLGTGCGILAFLAAQHCDNVFAVDLNPRAVQFARFNAQLNGITNVECLEGNFFEPVRGKRFDLVVANPPFVISPENRYFFRDSGMETR